MKGTDGRPTPVTIPGSEFEIPCDTIIPAIGQQLVIDFLNMDELKTVPGSYKTRIPGLYIGGDALRGASTAINAIAMAQGGGGNYCRHEIPHPCPPPLRTWEGTGIWISGIFLRRKATREFGYHPAETAVDLRRNFDLVISQLSPEDARKEASRCLQCDEICNVCVSVCPNFANFGYGLNRSVIRWRRLLQRLVYV